MLSKNQQTHLLEKYCSLLQVITHRSITFLLNCKFAPFLFVNRWKRLLNLWDNVKLVRCNREKILQKWCFWFRDTIQICQEIQFSLLTTSWDFLLLLVRSLNNSKFYSSTKFFHFFQIYFFQTEIFFENHFFRQFLDGTFARRKVLIFLRPLYLLFFGWMNCTSLKTVKRALINRRSPMTTKQTGNQIEKMKVKRSYGTSQIYQRMFEIAPNEIFKRH